MERSPFSRYVIAAITIVFLIGIISYRQYQLSQNFEMLGVVEGFYGTPWTHHERLDVVRFMGDVGMNVYFYAPKDDPFHRQRWREHYADDHLQRFQELIRVAEESNVRLFYAISPGLSMKYSDESDYQALLEKLNSLNVVGISNFALFLDDVPESLQHLEDQEKFSSLAEAHVYIINRLHNDLNVNGSSLVVCPTTYTDAWGSREYISKLGSRIPSDIPLFWTGRDVAISEILVEDAQNWSEIMSRKPLIWDNFPVNDFEQWRPILGPISGRSSALSSYTKGIVANPMDKPYLSMISLYTVAAYGRNPQNYDPDKAWFNALVHLAGADAARTLRPLVLLFSDYGWTDNVFTPLYTPGKSFNVNEVRDALTVFETSMDSLKSKTHAENEYIQKILPELDLFVRQIRTDYDAMLSDPYYTIDLEGFLNYQSERESVIATPSIVQFDGILNEWNANEFKYLNSSRTDDTNRVSVGFRYQDEVLNIGIKVKTNYFNNGTPGVWSDGDQVLLVLEYSLDRSGIWIQPTDLLIQVRPPSESGDVTSQFGSFYLTPFSQRGISDITMRTVSSFFEHFIGVPHDSLKDIVRNVSVAGTRVTNGYQLEIKIPVESLNDIRLNISVNDFQSTSNGNQMTNYILSRRPYIGNTNTYPEIIFR